jgi:hypothetical protein
MGYGSSGSHHPPRRRSRRAGVLTAVAVSVAVIAAACGASSGRGGHQSGPGRAPAGLCAVPRVLQCLRSHGAPFWPEPSQVPQGVFDNPNTYVITPRILAQEHGPGWQAALTACRALAPRQLPYTAAQIRALRSHLLKLAGCMRAHGITRFPAPVTGPYGGGFRSPGPGVKPDSAQFTAAQRACWRYAPGSERKAA